MGQVSLKATDFLDEAGSGTPNPVYAVFGDEAFLKRQVLEALKEWVIGGEDPSFSMGIHDGSSAPFSDVRDDLDMLSFTGGKRLIVVENADEFISRHRSYLENYLAKPSKNGILALPVKSLPSNTKVYKLIGNAGLVECKSLNNSGAVDWCVGRMNKAHKRLLPKETGTFLVESVGVDLGILDQELAKLAVSIPETEKLTIESIQPFVTRSRIDQIWKIFGMISRGESSQALRLLHQILEQGEEVIKCLGAFSFQLRKIAKAQRLIAGGVPMDKALEQSDIFAFARTEAQAQIRHLGPARLKKLLSWLVEIDMGLKGGSSIPPATQLERLLLKLAAPQGKPQTSFSSIRR